MGIYLSRSDKTLVCSCSLNQTLPVISKNVFEKLNVARF